MGAKEEFLDKIRIDWMTSCQTHVGLHPNPNFISPLKSIPQELLTGCRLYSDRNELIKSFKKYDLKRVAEVGVQEGFFNEFINDTLAPSELFAVDIDINIYTNRTKVKENIKLINKNSNALTFEDFGGELDLVYLDADHSYDSAKKDIQVLKQLISPGGFFVFNDFTIFSVHEMLFYGVAHAVTDFIVQDGWDVVGLALDEWNFYDIALQKPKK
jgi:SAM-dependent methyltransferase